MKFERGAIGKRSYAKTDDLVRILEKRKKLILTKNTEIVKAKKMLRLKNRLGRGGGSWFEENLTTLIQKC